MAGNRDVGRRGSKCRTKADLYEQASCEIDYYLSLDLRLQPDLLRR